MDEAISLVCWFVLRIAMRFCGRPAPLGSLISITVVVKKQLWIAGWLVCLDTPLIALRCNQLTTTDELLFWVWHGYFTFYTCFMIQRIDDEMEAQI